jgi:hypothetical protein
MAGSRVSPTPTPTRQRSTAAIVWSRTDPPAQSGRSDPEPPPVAPARVWPTVLTWLLLGGAIAALWALLLLGDSLVVSG